MTKPTRNDDADGYDVMRRVGSLHRQKINGDRDG